MVWTKYTDLVKQASQTLPDFTNLRRDKLAEIMGVSTKTINEMQARGLQSNEPGQRAATYDIRTVIRFMADERKAKTQGNNVDELKQQIMQLDAELRQVKLESQRANLVDVNELTAQWQKAGYALRERLERVSANHPDVAEAIADAVMDTINDLGIEQ